MNRRRTDDARALLRGFVLPPAQIPGELAAGASIAAVAIPVGLAYSGIVGVPPAVGLYASVAPTLAYALFGPSRYLIVGPDTATCMLIAATLATLGVDVPEARVPLAAGLALLTGIGCLAAALLRMGFIANLFSRPVLVGYMTGVALTLLIGQASRWTGVDLRAPGLLRPLAELFRRRAEIHLPTLACAAGLFAVLRLVKHFAPRLPAPAATVVAAVALSALLNLSRLGVETIGRIPRGLPALRLPVLGGHADELAFGVMGVLAISFASGILTARSFGARLGETQDANRELIGFGAANIAAGLFQGFGVTGADSRTAVGLAAGGRTRWTGVAAAGFVALALTVLTGPLQLLPVAALGAILASAAIDLMDFRAFRQLARIDWRELAFALTAAAGVIWIGVLRGVFLAVGLTLLYLLKLASWPRSAVEGRLPGHSAFVTLDHHPEALPTPGVVVYLFEASPSFLNADYFHRQALAAYAAAGPADWFVLDASLMNFMDSSALDALEALRHDLDKLGASLAIAGGHDQFLRVLERSDFAAKLKGGRLFRSPEAAVAAIERGDLSGGADRTPGVRTH
jgi:high affinity sulfate transporter 1